ncbi:MAG: LysM peptidoglycan-binding domain-containing protein [Bacteroidetes bacterium]|nr:MAG: LysM peptidoglycan-binding domain-containing protein [Bacteroidota bacterium]TAG88751.1 MAG: LysM peptidoglycan-binding domain-containing protein [Bacteroidota bacterium]
MNKGQNILNYRIEDFLGENYLFKSFSATHTQFQKNLIVKALKTDISEDDKKELIEEIKAMAQLQHPNIITLYDQISTDTDFYLVLENVPGHHLEKHLTEISGPLTEEKALFWLNEILNTFAYSHLKKDFGGAVHPKHIWITPDMHVKIQYLTLSEVYAKQVLKNEDKNLISTFSPERLENKTIDERSDVYSIGVLLWQMLTGKNPYQSFNLAETKYKILNENLPSAKKIYPIISEEIEEIIQKATAKNPNERYQTIAEFQEAIYLYQQKNIKTIPTINASSNTTENQEVFSKPTINLPAFLFVFLFFYGGYLVYEYANRPTVTTDVLFNLQDNKRIQSMQDSVMKSQAKKIIEDSIRIVKGNKKDTTEIYIHKVRKDETLESIARKYYTTIDTLKKLNSLTGKEVLKAKEGVKIRVRAVLILRREDNIAQIALKYKLSDYILKEVNELDKKKTSQRGYYNEKRKKQEDEVVSQNDFEGQKLVIPLIYPSKK